MSRGYFSRCFARFAGETFGECLRGMRLELAKSLLLETPSRCVKLPAGPASGMTVISASCSASMSASCRVNTAQKGWRSV